MLKKKTLKLISIIVLLIGTGITSTYGYSQTLFAVIDTSKGEIRVKLNDRAAPTSVANFANLAQRGFYDGLNFHRLERNFMVQGGDPDGNGTGGPGYQFQGEVNLRHNQPGIISMANSGPGTDGSQFFLTHLATPHLNGLHSVFGVVSEGLPVVQLLRKGDIINSIAIEGDLSSLFEKRKDKLEQWNDVLDANFTNLRAVPK
ncbi:MAG: peptidyl-prolyl cis-trans isomerase B (cyclophilin B) [Pseudohongiellaceae bacterium]|jgi:peptidyl-prolyl cis-trans isomerase B (cyclophilin B)